MKLSITEEQYLQIVEQNLTAQAFDLLDKQDDRPLHLTMKRKSDGTTAYYLDIKPRLHIASHVQGW